MTTSITTDLGCADVAQTVAAYALGALDPEERLAVAAHLARCPTCRALLDDAETTVGLLGGAVTPASPPPSLRGRLLAEIAAGAPGRPPAPVPAPATAPPARRPKTVILPRWTAVGLALVASLLLVAVVTGGVLVRRARDERDAARAAQSEIAEYMRHGGAVASLAPVSGAPASAGSGSLIVAPNQSDCLLLVYGLVPSAGDRHYRVWVARAGTRTRVDELDVRADGSGWLKLTPPEPIGRYDTVGITLAGAGNARQDLFVATIPRSATA